MVVNIKPAILVLNCKCLIQCLKIVVIESNILNKEQRNHQPATMCYAFFKHEKITEAIIRLLLYIMFNLRTRIDIQEIHGTQYCTQRSNKSVVTNVTSETLE